jgi:hypothetical protein
MYGMVNKAIEGLITENFGEETWEKIVDKSGVEDDTFISLEPYPDAVTYQLVGAASEVLDTPAAELLQAFGVYWTKYVGTQGYGELMALDDKPLGEFLAELNDMHTRVAITFPDLHPPEFSVESPEDNVHDVHYRSERPGLGPMVLGLLEGLLELKKLQGTVTWTQRKGDAHDHDVFRVAVG